MPPGKIISLARHGRSSRTVARAAPRDAHGGGARVATLHVLPLNRGPKSAFRAPLTQGGNLAVSVVVPTCSRPDLLGRCLEALVEQYLPPTLYEIIVVDDRPSPDTERIVARWKQRMASRGLEIFYLANCGVHGPAAARNRGWQLARAPIVAFTDDDAVPTPGWLTNGLMGFGNSVDALCGRIEMPLSTTPTDYERDAKHLETAEFVTANCFCCKEILEALQGFDEQFCMAWREDSDFHFRLLERQANILHAPQALVIHPIRPAPWGVSLRQQKKVMFDALLYKKHPQLYREKIRASPRWDFYLIAALLLTTLIAALAGNRTLAAGSGLIWLGLTARFCLMRLRGTAKTFSHITEMLITSALIPPYAVFWRLVGACRFRVRFV